MKPRQAAVVRSCLLFITLVVSDAPHAAAMQRAEPPPPELAWVGLFNDELIGWLENANRLDELCTADSGSAAGRACRAERMEPRVAVIPVRADARAGAGRLGEIVLVAWPGNGLRAFVSAGRVASPLIPDLYDSDWGYGPYFHQTILARRGPWFRVPLPSIGAGWINADDWIDRAPAEWEEYLVHTVRPGRIITTPRGDMFVLGADNRVLRVRPEQAADMWCQAGDPPPLASWQDVRIPFEQLFDSNGHLLIRYKYTRGC